MSSFFVITEEQQVVDGDLIYALSKSYKLV